MRPRHRGYPEIAGCSRIRDKGGPGQTSGAGGGRDGPGRPEQAEAGSGLTGARPEASCCLVPLGRCRGRPKKREPRPWTDLGSLGLCCWEARSGTKPSGLLFTSQCAGLKAIPIIPPDLSSFFRAKQNLAHHHLLHLIVPYLLAKPLLCLHCVSPLWNGCIFNQFFIHSHSLHPRPVSDFLFHRRRSDDTSYESETPAYAPFDHADHTLPDPTLSFLPEPIVVAASTRGLLCYAIASSAGTTSATLPPPPGSSSRRQPMTTAPLPPSPSSLMSRASITSNQIFFFHFFLFDLNRLI